MKTAVLDQIGGTAETEPGAAVPGARHGGADVLPRIVTC
jgi:hypothetical protein